MNDLSKRFVSAYNKIDKLIRNLYNFKANISFTEVVRKSIQYSSVIKKYEDDLVSYSRLRNAIVHNADDNIIIAEPHISVVENIERILNLIAEPPKAAAFSHKPVNAHYNENLKVTINRMCAGGYSNMPVIKEGAVKGVITNKLLVEFINIAMQKGNNIDDVLNNSTVSEALASYAGGNSHYEIVDSYITAEQAIKLFYDNRKLMILILTKGGTSGGEIVGILTSGDVIILNRAL